ncbi:MAG TPA: hypothetical protein VK304_00525 [Thermoleophilaceae bacterium]|nr:hypothetical protein [Thermoleophilaceae bacterium]
MPPEVAARVRSYEEDRRTVIITGDPTRRQRGVRTHRLVEIDRRRPPRRRTERLGARPDRVAAWAFLLGLLLVLVALTA